MTDPFRRRRCLVDRHCWRIELETAGLENVAARTTVSDDIVFETVLDDFCGEDPFSADPRASVGFRFWRCHCAEERPEVVERTVGAGV